MNSTISEHIRGNLLKKRQNLMQWLSTTPIRNRRMRLGPTNEQAVHAHLHTLDTALEKTAAQTLGICRVCQEHVDTRLLEMDYTACVCISHLSQEEIRSLEYELELSQVVQRGLLPHQVPEIPGLELAAFSRPAQIVGGDYFDFLQFQDGAHGLAIADVAGKGVSAGLLVASVQTALHTLVPTSNSPVDVLQHLNRLFCHNIHFTTFVTLFLGSFDHTTHRLTYGNAGHNPPLLFREQGNGKDLVSWLGPTGAAIGLIEESQFRVETITLSPGDILLFYTDGVTEAVNLQEEQFGEERLADLVRQRSSSSAQDLVRALRHALQEFTNGQSLADDTTIVACKIEK